MKTTPLTEKYGLQKRWVNWRAETRGGKTTKIPLGESDNPETWSVLADLPDQESVGIMFGTKKLLLGIDIDNCLVDGKVQGEKSIVISELLTKADTYCEVSPSGNGLHLFLQLTDPLDLAANRKDGYECYTTGRYFTVTGIPYLVAKDVRTVTPDEAVMLLGIIGYPWKKEKAATDHVRKAAKAMPTATLDDKDLFDKMFAAKNGASIKALYEGDISHYNDDDSVADMAFLSHLAFYAQGNAEQVERMWLASPIGSREKTQTRKDYRDRSISNAIANCKEFYTPSPRAIEQKMLQDNELELLFTISPKGAKIITQNTENVCRILRSHAKYASQVRFDEFRQTYEVRKTDGSWRDMEDSDAITMQTTLSSEFDFLQKVGKEMVFDAMIKVGRENRIDSAIDYVKSLSWDGEARLDDWLNSVYGAPIDDYHKAVASNWMKGLVKRLIDPGSKFDYVLVLEGKQGTKKSTSLSVLAMEGKWHVETTMSTDTKDFFMQFLGNSIVEFSEGETLSRTEVKRMKAIITTQFDKFRMPYERTMKTFPRRCVFAMTTNQDEYLKDDTGNRRWLPVALKKEADIEWLRANRDQLYAEAYHRLVVGNENVYEMPIDDMERQQGMRRIHDPNADAVMHWYITLTSEETEVGVTVRDAYQKALEQVFNGKISKKDEMDIASIFKEELKLEKRYVMTDGARAMRWFKADNILLKSPFDNEDGIVVNTGKAKSLDDF